MTRFQAPRGTQDVLPAMQPYWQAVLDAVREVTRLFGFQRIDTPVFEDAGVFEKGSGDSTDIVEKEMYVFEDRGGDRLALTPEGTPAIVRAYLEHGMASWPQPVRLYTTHPMFRYDRPQKGRYRQHTQFGAEVLGAPGSAADVDVLSLAVRTLQALGLREVRVHLNSVGDAQCRPGYLRVFREYFQAHYDRLDEDSRRRLVTNPLRILDSKVEQTRELARGAPRMLDYLCAECRAHFDAVVRRLEVLGIPVEVDPLIVRGLDYYTRTAAEVHYPKLGAQSTLFGGGRYDGLAEVLGGPPTPGVGFGMGLERVLLVLEEEGLLPEVAAGVQVYVCSEGASGEEEALRLVDSLRAAGVAAEADLLGRSLRAQLRAASRAGARWAVLVGVAGVPPGQVVLRDLQAGQQQAVSAEDVVRWVRQGEEAGCGRTGAGS